MIHTGDKVKYSRKYLVSIGSYAGDAAHATGTVTDVVVYNPLTVAYVSWDRPDLPEHVNVRNLVKVSDLHLEAV